MKNRENASDITPSRILCGSARRYAAPHLLLRTDLIRESFPDHCGYSIAVTALDLSAWRCDFAAARDLTVSAERARRLFERIAAGHVTPCTLRDVAEDWLADGGDS